MAVALFAYSLYRLYDYLLHERNKAQMDQDFYLDRGCHYDSNGYTIIRSLFDRDGCIFFVKT